jgi:thiol-disulfide isomerase/thioredoxin
MDHLSLPSRRPRHPDTGAGRLMRAVLAVVAAAALLTGCSSGSDAVDVNNGGEFRYVAATPAGQVIPVADRASAPEFAGTLLDGDSFESTSLAGQVAVLNFWGSWCPPCRVETPQFSAVSGDYAHEDVQFLGIDVKEQDQQFADAFVRDKKIAFPSLYDPRGEVSLAFRDYPPSAIPSTILLDRQYRVAAVYTGEVKQDDLRAVLDRVLAEEPS